MLVRRVQLCGRTVREDAGTETEGDIVEVDDVELSALQEPPYPGAIEPRTTRLVRDETREPRRSCPDGLHHQAARFRCGARLGPPAQDPPRIPVVDDGDVVATTNERARQALNPHGVPAKVIRRVERRDHGEAERPSVYAVTLRLIALLTR